MAAITILTSIFAILFLCLRLSAAATTRLPTASPAKEDQKGSATSTSESTVTNHVSTQATSYTAISSTSNSSNLTDIEDKYKPWEVFGIILLLALIATGICVGIVIKKKRRRELRAKRLKDEPSVRYTSTGNRKNTANPPSTRYTSPVFEDPEPPLSQSNRSEQERQRWPSEDSVASSEIGEVRMRKDVTPSLNTIRSADNIEGIGGDSNIQSDVRESIYDVPPVNEKDTKKLIE